MAGMVRPGNVRCGTSGFGWFWQARLGGARNGLVRFGEESLGELWFGRHGAVG